ncbi:glycosyltransferase 87 family protein [Actinoplanes sp. Pm04-4]|uniref:Glycosyltransferase 87 family protein n=1 Tax=Paractinoplanes pyxinae TaxID=2997416 RepID=A0ABT4AWC9_9ACTN|nr:glycosyltransferase 87 family protein [Actinoplanes pyxinae]MCY1138527.1 glycosyltransferase 87 family protein [Actinoplanes pyxinae]
MGKRWIWFLTAVVAAATAVAAFWKPAGSRLTDLSVYLGAVSGLADGAGLYDFTRGAAPFTYPPFAALLFTPLTWLPVGVVQIAWTLASLATVAGLAVLVTRRNQPVVALALMLSAPVSSDVKYGQVSLFLAALVAADFLALRRTPWHGALVGLAAAVKLTPLIFIPLLWLAGRRTAAAVATATFAACGLLAAATLPGDSWAFWTDKVFQVNRLGYIDGVGNQSLNGALLRLGIEADARRTLVLFVGGTVAAVALARAVRLARRQDWLSAVIVVGAASIVLSPVSWTHHQIWLVLAVLLPIGKVQKAVVLAVMILPVPVLFAESRLLLAVAVAALIPLHDDAGPGHRTRIPLHDDADRGTGMRTPLTETGGRSAVTVA